MPFRRPAACGRGGCSFRQAQAAAEPLEARRLLAATYYVSPAGNDAATGLTPATAFASVARVNSLNLEPGDKVLFEGGQTFALPAGTGVEHATGAFGNPNGAATLTGGSAKELRHELTGIQAGKAYTVNFRVGVDNPTDGRVRGGVWFYDAAGSRVGGVAFKLRNAGTFDRSRDFVAPPTFARAEVWISKDAGSSVVRLSSTSVRQTATPLTIDRDDAGTAAAPVTIGSYGTGRATINAGDATGISVNDAGGVRIRDLVVTGSWNSSTATGNNAGSGIEFISTAPNHGKHAFARVENVEVSGFKWIGVLFEGRVGKAGYSDIRITDVKTHHNGDSGLNLIRTLEETSTQYAYSDVYIARVEAYENTGMKDKNLPSGSGVIIEDCDRVTVEYSIAHHNGRFSPDPTAGPCGFLNANSDAVTIQHNESYANRSGTGKDGSGLDLDGGMTNSVLQYNYSHDNGGPGLQTAHYDLARDAWGNNVIRYNVSQNDARQNAYGGLHLAGGDALDNLEVYGNTVYMGSGSASGDIAAVRVKDVGSNVRLRNNLFIATGGVRIGDLDDNAAAFQNNAYWAGGGEFKLDANGSRYTSLAAWRNATGQERIAGSPTGLFADPAVAAPGAGGTMGTVAGPSGLTAYRLLPGSPLINAGVHVDTAGPRDFHGNALPQGGAFDIGAHEFAGQNPGGPAQPVVLRAADDAHVRGGSYAGQNFGSSAELHVKKSSSASSARETYLKFDLSGVSSVATAVLRLNGKIDHATQSPQVAVYAVGNTSWAEDTINWNNRPAAGATALATTTVSKSTPKWYELDVTSYLAAEKAAGRNIVSLLVRSLADTDPYLIFAGDEAAANRPELVVTPQGNGGGNPGGGSIVLSTDSIDVNEGASGAIAVQLAQVPSSDVVVTIAKQSGDADLAVSGPSQLTFTPNNWNKPQTFTLAAAHDADTANGAATFHVSALGLATRALTVREVDDDPSTPPGGGDTLSFAPQADAYVRDASYAGQNFGTATQLVVKSHPYAGNTRESYLRFSLSDFTGASSAKLRVFARSNSATQAVPVGLFAVLGTAWSETAINWNNKPAALGGATVLATTSVGGTGGAWYEFDVTSYVQQQKAAGAAQVAFVLKGTGTTDAQALIESDEASVIANRPRLVVTTGTPPPPQQALVVSAGAVSVPEGGSASFTLRLAAQPAGNVTVNISVPFSPLPDGDLRTPIDSYTFTPANWNVPQTVTVTADQDADSVAGRTDFRLAAAGIESKVVSATEIDDDTPAGPVVLRATADAYVRDGGSATQNFGSSTELQLKKSGSGSNREVLFKFDLSMLTSVSTAKLRVFGRIDSSSEKPSVAVFGAANTSWTEAGVNWNNRPATTGDALATTAVTTSTAKWYEWDVTAYLQAQKAAGATSVTLVLRSLTTTTPHMIFNSDEAATNRPELVVS